MSYWHASRVAISAAGHASITGHACAAVARVQRGELNGDPRTYHESGRPVEALRSCIACTDRAVSPRASAAVAARRRIGRGVAVRLSTSAGRWPALGDGSAVN